MNTDPTAETNAHPRAPLSFDPALYRHYLNEMDLTPAQADEMICALQAILIQFVDLGFNVKAVPQALGTDWVSLAGIPDNAAPDVLSSSHPNNQSNEEAP